MTRSAPLPEPQGLSRANLDTRRDLTLLADPVDTERTFCHPRADGFIVLISRNIKWAGDHAVTAADTHVGIIGDRAFFCLFECIDKTCRKTAGFFAVHALFFDVYRGRIVMVGESVYHSKRRGMGPPDILKHRFIFKGFNRLIGVFVPFIARPFAPPAPYAERRVNEHPVAFGIPRGPLSGRCALAADEGGPGNHRCAL